MSCRATVSTLLLAAVLPCVAAPPPVSAFFSNTAITKAAISPNGKMVAMRLGAPGQRAGIALVNLADNSMRMLAQFGDADIENVYWRSDRRVVFSVPSSDAGAVAEHPGLYGMDINGKTKIALAEPCKCRRSFAQNEAFEDPHLPQAVYEGAERLDSDGMYIVINEDGARNLGLIDARTGHETKLRAPNFTFKWVHDGRGRVRAALARENEQHVLYFVEEDGNYRKLAAFAPGAADALMPRFFDGALYVQARNGADRTSLYRYDLVTNSLPKTPLVTSPDVDIDAAFVDDGTRVLGVRINTDAEVAIWFDPLMKSIQAEVDALLPDTVNRIARGIRSETPFVLVHVYSPRHPGQVLVYNRDTKKLVELGRALPDIVPAAMSDTELVRFPARDGLSIPAYKTIPHGSTGKKLPLIILVGSDPTVRRASWAWDPRVQFLASRGYAVIQPQVRGTPGFGAAHARAVQGQWGLGTQDDLADAAQWAIKQGIADPERICIAGTHHGGAAALMGVIRDPGLFRCAVSWSGSVRIAGGDIRDKDTALPEPVLRQAANVKRPVLLAYGAHDVAVPGKHGRMLFDAIKPHNPGAEFHWYDEGGQNWSLESNRVDLWTRIEQFLGRHIGSR